MEKAGWLLIVVGVLLIVVKTVVDYWIAHSPKEVAPPTQGAFSAAKVRLPDLKDVAELLKGSTRRGDSVGDPGQSCSVELCRGSCRRAYALMPQGRTLLNAFPREPSRVPRASKRI